MRSLAIREPCRMVDFAASYLGGNARILLIASLDAGQTYAGWPSLKATLADAYGPLHDQEQARLKLFNSAQQGMLDDYNNNYHELFSTEPPGARAGQPVQSDVARQCQWISPSAEEGRAAAAPGCISGLYFCRSQCRATRLDLGLNVTWCQKTLFLEDQIDGQCISPDPKKIESVKTWPPPSSITQVRQFLGFSNYFRRFIDHFSALSRPLEEITGKNAHFVWSDARQKSFEKIRSALGAIRHYR